MALLPERQGALLREWVGEWELVADHSWPLQDTTVLHVRSAGGDHIVKASETSHHIGREVAAHQQVLGRLATPTPRLEHASVEEGILVTRYLPGNLVHGTPAEHEPHVYHQAGAILKGLQQPGRTSTDDVDEIIARVRETLDHAGGFVPGHQLEALRRRVAKQRSLPVRLHFTHGDYQPRNWLLHEGAVSVIDFGRALQRSWVSDLVRLQNQQFRGRPDIEHAFMDGLGRTLTETDARVLALETIQEGIGTVVWAHSIGDAAFEQHGRGMITSFLETDEIRA